MANGTWQSGARSNPTERVQCSFQFRECIVVAEFGSDEGILARFAQGDRCVELIRQASYSLRDVSHLDLWTKIIDNW